jgi:threonine dehydrogenase-like Zn-dependent dehydrogenase
VLFLTDILPTGFMGAELAEVDLGDTVVVFGCGPVGVFAARAAELRGAARVIAVDLDEGRLAAARARGCDTVNPASESLLERVQALTGGAGADAAIEAVGHPDLVRDAVLATRPGGRIAVVGVITQGVELPWPLLFLKNLTLRTGLVNPQAHVSRLLPLVASGRLDPTDIISHRLPLDEGVHGYELFAAHRDGALKVVLSP